MEYEISFGEKTR